MITHTNVVCDIIVYSAPDSNFGHNTDTIAIGCVGENRMSMVISWRRQVAQLCAVHTMHQQNNSDDGRLLQQCCSTGDGNGG